MSRFYTRLHNSVEVPLGQSAVYKDINLKRLPHCTPRKLRIFYEGRLSRLQHYKDGEETLTIMRPLRSQQLRYYERLTKA